MNTPQQSKIKQLVFPESTNRMQHLIRTVVHLVLAFSLLWLAFQIVTWVHLNPDEGAGDVILLILCFAFAIYYAVGNLLPRVRSIGWKPLTLLIVLIPIVGQLFWLALFFIPPKKEQQNAA